jgi:hypothetical protein
MTWHLRFMPVFYGVAFLLTFVSPYLSVGTYIVLLFYYALPGRTACAQKCSPDYAPAAASGSPRAEVAPIRH